MRLLILFITILISFHGYAQKIDIFKNKTKIEDPLKLRDPFRAKDVKSSKEKKISVSGGVRNGVFTNLETIENVPLSKIKITGIITGKERRAIAKIDGGKSGIILREGMKIGEDQAELKAILPGGIILVEKITNVYGQEEYLETVITISK
jgi:hypothetical protein